MLSTAEPEFGAVTTSLYSQVGERTNSSAVMSADSVVDAAIVRAGATVNADNETSTTRLRFINLVIFTSPLH
jgi:hypothetical protein